MQFVVFEAFLLLRLFGLTNLRTWLGLRVNLIDLLCDRVSPDKLSSLLARDRILEPCPLREENVPLPSAHHVGAHGEAGPVRASRYLHPRLVSYARGVDDLPDFAAHENLSVRVLHLEDLGLRSLRVGDDNLEVRHLAAPPP